MQTKTKIINKQTILIVLAVVVAFVSKFIPITPDNSFIADLFENNNELFKMGYWLLGIFGTLTILYYTFLKKKMDIDLLNSTFRIFAYIFSIGLLLTFLFGFWHIFYITNYNSVPFLTNLWRSISFRFTSTYLFTGEYFSLWLDFKDTLFISPYLITSILFYWAIKTNKKISNQHESKKDIQKDK